MHGPVFACGPSPHNRQTEVVKEPHRVCAEAILLLTLGTPGRIAGQSIPPSAGPDNSKPALSPRAEARGLAAGFIRSSCRRTCRKTWAATITPIPAIAPSHGRPRRKRTRATANARTPGITRVRIALRGPDMESPPEEMHTARLVHQEWMRRRVCVGIHRAGREGLGTPAYAGSGRPAVLPYPTSREPRRSARTTATSAAPTSTANDPYTKIHLTSVNPGASAAASGASAG
jgi:hypothetical protein